MTDQELPDNGEDDDLLPGEPSVHEVVEFSIAVALDLEASLDEDENPFESVVQININAGHLLYMCYILQDMWQVLEDQTDEDMDALEQYVKAKKRTPTNTNVIH